MSVNLSVSLSVRRGTVCFSAYESINRVVYGTEYTCNTRPSCALLATFFSDSWMIFNSHSGTASFQGQWWNWHALMLTELFFIIYSNLNCQWTVIVCLTIYLFSPMNRTAVGCHIKSPPYTSVSPKRSRWPKRRRKTWRCLALHITHQKTITARETFRKGRERWQTRTVRISIKMFTPSTVLRSVITSL